MNGPAEQTNDQSRKRRDHTILLPHLQATRRLGQDLAAVLQSQPACPLLLEGELGCGKTTLVRAIVEQLPGSEQAEVNSPSFNICNLYPTQPTVAHFDLYRLGETGPEESVFEYLADPSVLVIVEWAEHLPALWRPPDYLQLTFYRPEGQRGVYIAPRGSVAQDLCHILINLHKKRALT